MLNLLDIMLLLMKRMTLHYQLPPRYIMCLMRVACGEKFVNVYSKNSLQAEMTEIAVLLQNLFRRYAQHLVLCVVDMIFFFLVEICDADF